MEPFSLKMLSYWSFLKTNNPFQSPPLVNKAILSDVLFLKELHGSYEMAPSETGNGCLLSAIDPLDFSYCSGVNFIWEGLGDLIHEWSIDNSDSFSLGVNKFTALIGEGDTPEEQCISFNREIFHVDGSTLLVLTKDVWKDWLFGHDKQCRTVEMKVKKENDILIVSYTETMLWNDDVISNFTTEAKFLKVRA